MDFDTSKVMTCVTADQCEICSYGYFANNLASLKKAVEEERTNLNAIYSRLLHVESDNRGKRFGNEIGYFGLFYMTDLEEDEGRY